MSEQRGEQHVAHPECDPRHDQTPEAQACRGRCPAAQRTQVNELFRPQATSPVIQAKDEYVAGQHPVEEDGNRSTGPPFMRIKAHANGITNEHDTQIHSAQGEQPEPRAASGMIAPAPLPAPVDPNLEHQQQDDNLAAQQGRVIQQSRKPFFRRRKKADMPEFDQHLAQHAQSEQSHHQPQ